MDELITFCKQQVQIEQGLHQQKQLEMQVELGELQQKYTELALNYTHLQNDHEKLVRDMHTLRIHHQQQIQALEEQVVKCWNQRMDQLSEALRK